MTSRIDAVLEAARARLRRLQAADVPAALRRGAVLVDIRPAAQRRTEGELAEHFRALVIERNVLEQSTREGIFVDAETWRQILGWGEKLGVELQTPD